MSSFSKSNEGFIVLDSVDEKGQVLAQLQRLLTSARLVQLSVKPVCIVGERSSGKSSLMNFMIRYLRYLEKKSTRQEAPLGAQDVPLKGFPWNEDDESRKPSIRFWNKVFILDNLKVAVLLMDTVGILDGSMLAYTGLSQKLFHICLSAASILIYNIQGSVIIQHMENLNASAVSYEEAQKRDKFLGRLVLLVRDWNLATDFPHGSEGGNKYLEHFCELQRRRALSSFDLLRRIDSFYGDLDCFLMPFPGEYAAGFVKEKKPFDGSLKDLQPKYKQQVIQLMEETFSMSKLEPRRYEGQSISCGVLASVIKSHLDDKEYIVVNIHQTQSETTRKKYCDTLLTQAVTKYKNQMMKVLSGGICLNEEDLANLHKRNQSMAFGEFVLYMDGDKELHKLYEQKLLEEIAQCFHIFTETNASNKKRPGSDILKRATNEYTTAMEEATADWAWYGASELKKKHESAVERAKGILETCEGLQDPERLKKDLSNSCESSFIIVEETNKNNRIVSIIAKILIKLTSGVIVWGFAKASGASPLTAICLAAAALILEVVTNIIYTVFKECRKMNE